MKTAIVVSGVLRYMKQASTSWKYKGDYFLAIDRDFYEPQSPHAIRPIYEELAKELPFSIQFKSITISEELNNGFAKENSSMKMAWKWKCAYNSVLPYHQFNKYDTVLLLRPDMYVHSSDYILPSVEKNTIIATQLPHIRSNGLPWATDCFLYMNFDTFSILSTFYNYLFRAYFNPLEKRDIHYHMNHFYEINNIKISDEIKQDSYVILRENCVDLFNDSGLKDGLTYMNISEKTQEWWKKKYG